MKGLKAVFNHWSTVNIPKSDLGKIAAPFLPPRQYDFEQPEIIHGLQALQRGVNEGFSIEKQKGGYYEGLDLALSNIIGAMKRSSPSDAKVSLGKRDLEILALTHFQLVAAAKNLSLFRKNGDPLLEAHDRITAFTKNHGIRDAKGGQLTNYIAQQPKTI